MVFSSLTFLYLFLPLAVLPYFLVKNRTWRNGLLLVLSLFFYAWGEPKYVVMMLAATVVAYAGGLAIETLRGRPKACKVAFVLTVCLVTANLLVFKYANFLWDTLNSIVSTGVTLPTIALPIGISFYTFQILSYVIDLYWGKVHVQRNFFYLLLYVSFFPQLIAGPIVRYSTIEDEILHRKETWDDVEAGLKRFLLGLAKKVLIANNVAALADMIYQGNQSIYGTALYWLASVAYTMQIYFSVLRPACHVPLAGDGLAQGVDGQLRHLVGHPLVPAGVPLLLPGVEEAAPAQGLEGRFGGGFGLWDLTDAMHPVYSQLVLQPLHLFPLLSKRTPREQRTHHVLSSGCCLVVRIHHLVQNARHRGQHDTVVAKGHALFLRLGDAV